MSLCILAALPLLIAVMLSESAVAVIAALCVTLALAGLGTTFLIRVGIRWESLQKLLEEGDYSREAKRGRHGHGGISAAFWLGTVVPGRNKYSKYHGYNSRKFVCYGKQTDAM